MKPLYDTLTFENAKGITLLPLECCHCGDTFHVEKRFIKHRLNRNGIGPATCSTVCRYAMVSLKQTLPCVQCGQLVTKEAKDLKKVKNAFCSKNCAATYNNLHKTKGNRRSKLEVWLEAQLAVLYPELTIEYCNKAAINGELDVYVPSLRLAFELNGIYHYEPIHGQGKLNQVQSNDGRKFQACIEHGIELVIMDTSQLKYFKEANCLPYLHIIQKIVDIKLANVSQP